MTPSQPAILTIDIGTTSTRAMLYDAQARLIPGGTAQRSNQLQTSGDGGAIFEADHLLDGIVTVIDQILQRTGEQAASIAAVALDSLVGNILGVDASGKPLTPVYIYADTRNASDAQSLRSQLGPYASQNAHDRTGTLIHTSYLPARLCWLERTDPTLFASVARWVTIGEYLFFRLFGRWSVSYSVAAWGGLLNRHYLTWDAEWLARLPVHEEQLSPLADFGDAQRGLRQEWSRRWPHLAELPWFLTIGDGAAANIGSGCDRPERVALTIGTTGAMRVVVDPSLDRVPGGLWLYRVDAGRALLGGATTEGGNLYAWLREMLLLPGPDELERLVEKRPPAAHGLTVLPFVGGERAPGWREDARATFAGMSLHTTPVDLVQAGLEAIAYRFALIYRRIRPYLPETAQRQIIASGGAILSSPAWLQIMADVLGEPLLALDEKEATSRGLALLALEQLGIINQPADLPPTIGATYLPNPEHHARHTEAAERQIDLYQRLLGKSES